MNKAVVKTYSKSELADLYERPVRTLMNWIKKNESLCADLENTGYEPTQKAFNPRQVKLIFFYLETPYVKEKEVKE